ncbi:hypothetical protein Pmani_029811 [Petrolisthes manimaculis]|uniref:Uncharacterized protein n=1 Tax=Petrolisthes manimaculis TaxID=1843537 RepID=A0AAE1NXA5_9EUCA|nr:hypothetical protein Pmani_029811 [Petrolisthes manimaculis]
MAVCRTAFPSDYYYCHCVDLSRHRLLQCLQVYIGQPQLLAALSAALAALSAALAALSAALAASVQQVCGGGEGVGRPQPQPQPQPAHSTVLGGVGEEEPQGGAGGPPRPAARASPPHQPPPKMRRTSLPAISVQRPASSQDYPSLPDYVLSITWLYVPSLT